MGGNYGEPDDPWQYPKMSPSLTEDEIKAVRYITPLVTSIRSAGVVFKAIGVVIKWGGFIILFGLALKDGLPLSQLINLWSHG